VELEPSGARGFSGYIPASAVVGDILEYYVSLVDRRGVEVGAAGSTLNPYPVALMFGEGGGDYGGGYPEPDDPYGGVYEPYEPAPAPGRRRRVHLLLGAGSGVGWILGGPLREFPETDVDPGVADTAFHVYSELGFYAAEDLMVLLAGRFQFLIATEKTRMVPLPSLRLRYFYDADIPTRQFVGFGGGYCGFVSKCGYVENRVALQDQNYVDTAPKGPGHVGVEGGLTYGSGSVEFLLSGVAYALFPQTSFQLDVNLGLAISF